MSVSGTRNDNVYFNAGLINKTNISIPAQFVESRSDYIVRDPSKYYLILDKLYMSTFNVPLFDLKVLGEGYDSYALSVSIQMGVNVAQQYVQYFPISNNREDIINRRVFNIYQFVTMINIAIAGCVAQYNVLYPPLPASQPPLLIYSPTDEKFSFLFDAVWQANNIGFFMNESLYRKFAYLNSTSPPDTSLGRSFQISIEDDFNGNFLTAGQTAIYSPTFPAIYTTGMYVQKQYLSTLNSITDIIRIIITTQSMPVNKEYISDNSSESSNDYSAKILGDVYFNKISTTENNAFRFSFSDKLIDLKSTTPLYAIDYQIVYEANTGEVRKLLLYPNDSVYIKFAFVNRAVHSNSYTSIVDNTNS